MTAPGSNDLDTLVREHVEALRDLSETIEQHPRDTIKPEERRVDTGGERALALLAELAGDSIGVHIERTIGEGGFGVVHLGTQVVLGRRVAIKTLKPDFRTDAATIKLMREAWVTGALDHPNVVPVHDVELAEDRSPMIVMKAIEGVTWSSVMNDEAVLRERYGAADPLEWNLAVLLQVCNAVSYAHDRGILHRDLKPDNVMIGSFGEVFVVDWGIAVSLLDDGSGRLPLARDARELAGTPSYMAPEMLGGPSVTIDERTDVYLLGAVLHEIAAGRPPHRGEVLMQVIQSVVLSQPSLPEGTSPELARIVTKAMSRLAENRFVSVDEFRTALRGFVRHRGSEALALETEEQLDQLCALLDDRGVDPAAAAEQAHGLLGACRFGFQRALREWPENERARRGLHRAIEAMAEHQLRAGDAGAAALLLSELASPDPELARRVRTAKNAADARLAGLEQLRSDLDPTLGLRTRSLFVAVFCTLWMAAPLVKHLLPLPDTHMMYLVPLAGFLVVAVGFLIWARESMMRTAVNRRAAVMVLIAMVTMCLAHVGGMLLDVPVRHVLIFHMLFWSSQAVITAFVLDYRFWYTAVGFLAAFLVSTVYPEVRDLAVSASVGVLFVVSIVANRAASQQKSRPAGGTAPPA